MLPTIKELQYYPEQHRYQYEGDWLLYSVSGVLRHFMDARTKAAIEYYRTGENGWEERGNFIHKVLEKMLKGQKIKAEGKYEKWIKPLQESDLFQDAEILASEYALCDKERSVGGSFDFLLKTIFRNPKIILYQSYFGFKNNVLIQLGLGGMHRFYAEFSKKIN